MSLVDSADRLVVLISALTKVNEYKHSIICSSNCFTVQIMVHSLRKIHVPTQATLYLYVILTFTMQREQQCSRHINDLTAVQHTWGWVIYIRCQELSLAHHNISIIHCCAIIWYHKNAYYHLYVQPLLLCSLFYWFEIKIKKTGIQLYVACMFAALAKSPPWVLQWGCSRWRNRWISSRCACLSCINSLIFIVPCSYYSKPEWFMSDLLSSSYLTTFCSQWKLFPKVLPDFPIKSEQKGIDYTVCGKQALIFNHS